MARQLGYSFHAASLDLPGDAVAQQAIRHLSAIDHVGFFDTIPRDFAAIDHAAGLPAGSRLPNIHRTKGRAVSRADALATPGVEARLAADYALYREAERLFREPDRQDARAEAAE
jgi:hypothetical protein